MLSRLQDIEANAKVGVAVGFKIDSRDAILSEIMGETGEINRDQ